MINNIVKIEDLEIGGGRGFVLIAGPCVVEGHDITIDTASRIKEIAGGLGIPLIFKASYKKANRTSLDSFTGMDQQEALSVLKEIKESLHLPILTDVHEREDIETVRGIVDVLQIPAFLCRQTELLLEAGKSGLAVNIKKGQFLPPWDMKYAAEKVKSTGNERIMLTERGTTFGYGNLVVDIRSLPIMRDLGYPVVMDATHSVQMPGLGNTTGGDPKFIRPLARAAAAVGIDALFLEVHPCPEKALSDASCQLRLSALKDLLEEIQEIDFITKREVKDCQTRKS